MTEQQDTRQQMQDIFEPFPAPRVWQFGGDMWAGAAHQTSTADYLPSAPSISLSPRAISSVEISIIRSASAR